MHRTVQRLMRERLGDEQAVWADAAVRFVLAAFPPDPSDIRVKDTCSELLPHASAALDLARALESDPVARATLQDRVGVYLHTRAQFADAKEALEHAFDLFAEARGFEARETATAENHLGSLMRELGDYDSAQKHHISALKVHRISSGPESIDVARDNLELARTLTDRGDLPAAKHAFEEALGGFGDASADTYRAIADCHVGLFVVAARSGNFLRGKRHLEHVGSVYDEFQPGHPEAAFFRFIHERFFGDAGRAPTGQLEAVVELAEETYGKRHPEVAEWTRWLADDHLSRGEIDAASAAYDRALAVDRAAYGENHLKVGRDLFSAFAVFAAKGDADEARGSLEGARAIFDQAAVPDIAFARFEDALGSLAVIPAAVAQMKHVCEITFDLCGDEDPLTASALGHLAAELEEAGELDDAQSFAIASLDRLAMHYGPDHDRVAHGYGLLGSIQFKSNDLDGARKSYEHARTILEAAQNPNQLELTKILTGLYPILAASDDRRALAAAGATSTAGKDEEAGLKTAPEVEPEAPAVLERAIAVAEETAAVAPLIELCDEALHPAGRFEDEDGILSKVLTAHRGHVRALARTRVCDPHSARPPACRPLGLPAGTGVLRSRACNRRERKHVAVAARGVSRPPNEASVRRCT